MEEHFGDLLNWVALGVEAVAGLCIAVGAIEAVTHLILLSARASRPAIVHKRHVWVRFAAWLLLALEFQLAADVLRTTITPSWDDIGQLASIAVIRTFLNYFLEKDIEKYAEALPTERPEPGTARA